MKTFKKPITSKAVELFFNECDNDLIYYTPKYLKFLKNLISDIEVDYYCFSDTNQKIVALMPAAKKNIKGKGTIINSLPFYGSHGGVLFLKSIKKRSQIQRLLVQELLEDSKNESILSITLVENPFIPFNSKSMQSIGFQVIDNRLGQFKNISFDLFSKSQDDGLLMSFHSKTRNVVRKGLSFNPEFLEQNDAETIGWLQNIHEKSITKLNGKFKTIEVFNNLIENFPSPENSRLFLVKLDGKKVAGILVLLHHKTVEYFTPVIEEEYKHTQLLSSLIYNAMNTLSREGYELWNWGGTWESQEGVYRFKDRFGSFTMPYRYFSKIENQAIKEIDKDILSTHFNFFYSYKFDL
jgi:hypothetical protein